MVTELSDEGLADREVSVDIGRTIVSALGRPKKRPFASRVFIFIIYLPHVLCEATTRRYGRAGQNLTGAGTLILGNWDFKLGTLDWDAKLYFSVVERIFLSSPRWRCIRSLLYGEGVAVMMVI